MNTRIAIRRLAASPGYTLATVVTLALAIGATTAIFSAVYAVLLKPMPIRQPDQLVVAWGFAPTQSTGGVELSYLDIQDLANATPRVATVASFGASTWSQVLDGEGEPARLEATGVSGSFFDVLGATPHLGRPILSIDDVRNAPRVVVLSHGSWIDRFGGDPAVIGRRILLDDEAHEVIGVMPASFAYPKGTELWIPVTPVLDAASKAYKTDALRNVGVLFMVGRLNAGVTPAMAGAEWTRVNARLQEGSPAPRYDLIATPFLDFQIGPARQAMWPLFGAVGVLLLIACANVSGLMLTRVSLRSHDDAIRMAIGASRVKVARQWAAETLMIVVAGAAMGLLTCRWFISGILALAPEGIPRLDEVAIDVPVAVFSLSVMALATLLCGAAPLRLASMVNLVETLNDGSRTIASGRSYRTRSTLLVVQVGLAVMLLVAAGLVVRSFAALQNIDMGFERAGVLRLKVEPRAKTPPADVFIRELLPRIADMPAVESAGAVYLTPMELGSIGHGTWVGLEGQPNTPETARQNPVLNYLSATPGYFEAMRIPLKHGRLFTDDDRADTARVSIISESTASKLFPNQDPIGKRFHTSAFSADPDAPFGAWRTVVGVVGDVRYRGINEVQLDMYDPPAQTRMAAASVVVRLKPEAAPRMLSVAAAVEAEARRLDPRVLVSGIMPLDTVVNRAMAPWRFSAWVFSLFSGLAFTLSMLGLFSLVSLDVANRRQEFAIRMAIGATNGDIVRGVFRSAGVRAGAGLAVGLAATLVATRSLRSLLVGVELTDWQTYASVVALVAIVVSVASYLPARRAVSAAPLTLLRRQ